MIKQCQLCEFKAPSLKYLLKHIRQAHSHRPGFSIKCSLGGCLKLFRTFKVFRNHVYTLHGEHKPVVCDSQSTETTDPEDIEDPSTTADEEVYEDISERKCQKRTTAMWILKIQESCKLPQSTMETVLHDITGFIQDLLVDIEDEISSCLTNAGVDPCAATWTVECVLE